MKYATLTTSAVLIGSLALSACGSSDPGGTRAGAAPKAFNFGDNTATYNAANGSVSLDGTIVSQNGDQVNKANGQANVTRSGNSIFFSSIASDGATYAISSVSTSGAKRSGQIFGTNGISNAPSNSFATYTGDYAGTITTTGASQTVTDTITGDITIGANFDNNTFQGNINNRQSFRTTGSQRGVGDTVGFSGRISSDLSFQGTASGGALTEGSRRYTGSNGLIRGVIGGDQGQSAAGVFEMDHTSGTTYTERGAFVAGSN